MPARHRKLFLLASGLPVALAAGWVYCPMEIYCVFYPSIDTTFAKGYSEIAFGHVHPGMPGDDVRRLIGPPLSVVKDPDGGETWWYSEDGRCWFGDFAWLGRSVRLVRSTVVRTERRVYAD